ncbi:alpha-1,2-fucosyltransferase [Pseudomonas sp. LRF_L74]|uniref:alpha-1,2-fucosyltransferase n=1 Tax=Pseudomonas sp. LRF_L74 TaxID=3369422 RepID=UPI003F63BEC3
MIITNVIGGLGNQMFQYAAGRALSIRHNVPLLLDIRGFEGYGLHNGFELSRIFAGPFAIASEKDVKSLLEWRISPLVQKALRRPALRRFSGKHYLIEPHMHYWSGFDRAPEHAYLYGYWQVPEYFSSINDVLRKEFSFKQGLKGANLDIWEKMQGCESVSIHIRRGDYISNIKASAIMAACGLDYYRGAVSHFLEKPTAPVFFIFSDDLAWVKENLKIPAQAFYIEHNTGVESYNDMRLMAGCKHNVIANSSFSWWGAWLNDNLDKIVIAPKIWFKKSSMSSKDLVPKSWLRF